MALTYDDGPGPSTGAVMDLLGPRRAATFSWSGRGSKESALAREDESREATRSAPDSMHHLDHEQVDRQEAVADMVAGAQAIADVLGFEPRLYAGAVRILRPGHGGRG